MRYCGVDEKVKKLLRKRLNNGRGCSSYNKQVRMRR
jgi:hypothetical protein